MKIQAIKKSKVSEQVFEQMITMLINKDWKQGDKIPSENVLAGMFEVSRVTIRNALQKLIALGLIETRLGEGSFVKKVKAGAAMISLLPIAYNESTAHEILEFFELLTTKTMMLAFRRMEQKQMVELSFIVERMKETRSDKEVFLQYDKEFHFKIAAVAGNSMILQTYHIIWEMIEYTLSDAIYGADREVGCHCCEKLVAAFINSDCEAACDAMKDYIANIINRCDNHWGNITSGSLYPEEIW